MAIEVFNRYEKKYLLTQEQFECIYNIIREHMTDDKHNNGTDGYSIANIYYDTEYSSLIRESVSKPKYKQKLRLRSYSVPNPDDFVFLEIKKKVDKLVNKRRCVLKLYEAYEFLETKKKPPLKDYMNPQVLGELEYFLKMYPLRADTYLAYDRIAFFEKDNPSLRISFDENIRSRRHDLALEAGDYGESLMPDGAARLMEIKTSTTMPIWLTRALSEYEIYHKSFSKYGTAYIKKLEKEQLPCRQSQIYLIQQPHRVSLQSPQPLSR